MTQGDASAALNHSAESARAQPEDVTYVLHRFLSDRTGEKVDDDTNIFETGLVTSMFALELVDFLEGEFAITIEIEDLDLQNFSTVSALVDFVNRKRG